MEYPDRDINYDDIIEILLNTFGNTLSRDCLLTIIDDCGGDLEQSANAVINMMECSMESTNMTGTTKNVVANEMNTNQRNISPYNIANETKPRSSSTSSSDKIPEKSLNTTSYATASRKHGQPLRPKNSVPSSELNSKVNTSQLFSTDQLKQILSYHENGARVLIIMRGLSGSGKSYLARKLIDSIYTVQSELNYSTHIFSTDNYFMQNNVYMFDRSKLSEYHEKNERMAKNSMLNGVSPVIIDNTNVELWEMKNYVYEGVKNGYIIEVVEPNTPWMKNARRLQRNSVHNVPLHTIQRKLESYQYGVTGAYLIRFFKYNYESNMKPPVLRLVPPFYREIETTSNDVKEQLSTSKMPEANTSYEQASQSSITNDAMDSFGNMKLTETQISSEDIQKIEEEWDNGEDWNDDTKNTVKKDKCINMSESRPQRKDLPKSSTKEKLLPPIEECCQDWSKISVFLPSWGENNRLPEETKIIVEKKSSSTCIELGDTEISVLKNPLKIITAKSRDINQSYVELKNTKIPDKWMLDKSTSTCNNQILSDHKRCANEEQHFKMFQKMFKNIAQSDLRHVFDQCCGDVNWAMDIVLDGVDSQRLPQISNDVSDTEAEEENVNICTCLSAYEILPDHNESTPPIEPEQKVVQTSSVSNTKKVKKDIVVSEESIKLKRQIEENVVIPDNHYSEHCLKIRKVRRGECDIEENEDEINTSEDNVSTSDSQKDSIEDNPSTSEQSEVANAGIVCKYDDSSESTDSELFDCPSDAVITINVGETFIKQLDILFGRGDMIYPPSIQPKFTIRISRLNEMNALWMESIMHQIEENSKQTDLMIKQDEEFARELERKEKELLRQGEEPAVPDFMELMDMDLALYFYNKDVEKWRDQQPRDLAAILSREKLYNLFPEISKNTLSEMLVAHNNLFFETVEGLLASTGQGAILMKKNGINKFVMEREIARQKEILNKEKKALCKAEWPLLPTHEKVDMEMVQRYRVKAEKHLETRNLNFGKAQDYIRRGMTQVASYYSEFASYHTQMYEQSNSLAAASLMQLHASNTSDAATVDLHYLKVCEARESLDLFIDSHIQRLREMQDTNGNRSLTLFFITGRGLHSNGRPRVKPAVMKRLRERGLFFNERNPGLLTSKVCAYDKLSYQIA